MNIQLLLPVLSQIAGRDLSPEVDLFYRARAAIGKSLNHEGQQFFIQNWKNIPAFMETDAGQAALVTFINAWGASFYKPTVETPQAELPPPTEPLPGEEDQEPTI